MTEQFGLLKKSFRDIKKDFINGLGFKNSLLQTSISNTDYQALQKFNSAIMVTNDGLTKSQRITKAWDENMTECSIAAKRMGNDLVTGKKNIQDISKAANTASGSTKALGVAMNVMSNVGIMLAITAITNVISKLAQAQETAVQATKEATEKYRSELDSISDYKQRLSELHEQLKSGNLSYEETKKNHAELMSIQDELIEKYGTEKGAIESVTEAVNGQVDALDSLSEKAYRDWVAKADEQTFWNKLLPGSKSGLDQSIDYMETKKTVSFADMENASLGYGQEAIELREIQKEIDKKIQDKYNLDKTFAMFNVTGTPDELRTQLENILQDYADISEEVFTSKGIDWNLWEEYRKETTDSINEAINSLDKGLEKHQDTYRTYIEGVIKYDSEYSDEYANILQKRAELESAQNSGNEEEEKRAKQEFMDSINDAIIASDSDESIKKYFESLYPELQAEFPKWKFEFDLEANKNSIYDIAKELGKNYTATDLLNMIDTEGVQEGEESFNSLIDKAIKYGVCTDKSAEEVQKLIDLLIELGIVQGNTKGYTPDDKNSISSFPESWQSLASNARNELLELARAGEISDTTLQSNKDYNTLLKDTGFSAKKARDEIMSMISVQEKMAGFQSKMGNIGTLYNEFRDKGFVTSETLEGLPDVFKEMNGGKDFDLFRQIVGDPTSGKEKIKDAFDDIVTAYLKDQNILAGTTNKTRNSVVANLTDAGVTNAAEIVDSYLHSINLINAAEDELYNRSSKQLSTNISNFQKALKDKNTSFSDACKVLGANNAALMTSMGKQYTDDYVNWIKSINKKKKAWNRFVKAYNKATDVNDEHGVYQQSQKWKTDKDGGHGATPYAIFTEVKLKQEDAEKAAEKAKRQKKKMEKYATIDLNFDSAKYTPSNPSASSNSSGSSNKTKAKQEFDWLQRYIDIASQKIDLLKSKFENLFSIRSKDDNLTTQIKNLKKELSAYNKQADIYSKKAKSYGKKNLSIDLRDKAARGQIKENYNDLVQKYGEKKANQITKYQEYIDKANEARKATEETLSSIMELNRQKLDNITSWYDTLLSKIESVQSRIQSTIDLTSKISGMLGKSETGGMESYENLIKYQSKELSKLKEEREKIEKQYNKTIQDNGNALDKTGEKGTGKSRKKEAKDDAKKPDKDNTKYTEKASDKKKAKSGTKKPDKKETKESKKNNAKKSDKKGKTKKSNTKKEDEKYKQKTNAERDTALNEYDSKINQAYSDMLDTAAAMADIPIAEAEAAIERLGAKFDELSHQLSMTSGYVNEANIAYATSVYRSQNKNKMEQHQENVTALQTAENNQALLQAQLAEKGIDASAISSTTDLTQYGEETAQVISKYIASCQAVTTAQKNVTQSYRDYQNTVKENAEALSNLTQSYYDSIGDDIDNDRNNVASRLENASSTEERLALIEEDTRLAEESVVNKRNKASDLFADSVVHEIGADFDAINYEKFNFADSARAWEIFNQEMKYDPDTGSYDWTSIISDDGMEILRDILTRNGISTENLEKHNTNAIAYKKANQEAESEEINLPNVRNGNAVKAFNFINEDFERTIAGIEDNIHEIDNAMAISEANGNFITQSFYQDQMKLQEEELEKRKQQAARLKEELDHSNIEVGTPKWFELKEQVDNTNKSVSDMNVTLAQTAKSAREAAWEGINKDFERPLDQSQRNKDDINRSISIAENTGNFVTASYYEKLLKEQQTEHATRNQKIREMEAELALQVAAGDITYGKEEWYQRQKEIDAEKDANEELAVSMTQTAKSAREAKRELDDFALRLIDDINEEADFYQGLIEREEQFDENGNLTDYGKANMALSLVQMSNDIETVRELKISLEDLDAQYSRGKIGLKEYTEQKDALLKQQRESINAYYGEVDAIKSLVEEGLNAEMDAMNDLIGKYKNAMSEAKSLRDYQNSIEEHTKNIASLEKQRSVLSMQDSEEARSKLQAIEVELSDARKDLEEMEYDKYLEDQESMLDKMSEDFQSFMEQQLENMDSLINQIIDGISGDGKSIYSVLEEISNKWGLHISKELGESVKTSDYSKTPTADNPLPSSHAGDVANQAADKAKTETVKARPATKSTSTTSPASSGYPGKIAGDKNVQRKNNAINLIKNLNLRSDKSNSYHDDSFNHAFYQKTGKYPSAEMYGGLSDLYGKKGADLFDAIDKDSLFEEMKHLGKFATGGIAKAKPANEDGLAWVRNGEGMVRPEDVPIIQKLMDSLPVINNIMNHMIPVQTLPAQSPSIPIQKEITPAKIGTIQQTFHLPNVTDTDSFIKTVQTDPKMQRFMGDLFVDHLRGGNSNMKY